MPGNTTGVKPHKSAASCADPAEVRLPNANAEATTTKLAAAKTAATESTAKLAPADSDVATGKPTGPKRIEDDWMTSRSQLRKSVAALKLLILALQSLHLQALKALSERLVLLSKLLLRSHEPEVILSNTATTPE